MSYSAVNKVTIRSRSVRVARQQAIKALKKADGEVFISCIFFVTDKPGYRDFVFKSSLGGW